MHWLVQQTRAYPHVVRWLSKDRNSPAQLHPFPLLLHMTLSALTSCSPTRNSLESYIFSFNTTKSLLTSDISKVLSSFPTVWANVGVLLMFIQTGFAVDPPTACHLTWTASYIKADLTHQLVWWGLQKIAVISTRHLSSWNHLLQLETKCSYVVTQLYKDGNMHKWLLLVAANSSYCAGSVPTSDPAWESNCAYGIARWFLAMNSPMFVSLWGL